LKDEIKIEKLNKKNKKIELLESELKIKFSSNKELKKLIKSTQVNLPNPRLGS
jgi:hypothetical protein